MPGYPRYLRRAIHLSFANFVCAEAKLRYDARTAHIHFALDRRPEVTGTMGGGAQAMNTDTILLILFGSVIAVTTALTFMEVRRLRKKLTKE